jgi:ABC-2 type transport system ATP-binding protein
VSRRGEEVKGEGAAIPAQAVGEPGDLPKAPPHPLVSVRGLRARYPGARHPALDGVDLHLGVGAMVLLGPAGAGKSTLLRVLAGQLPPEGGEVEVVGRDALREPLAVRAVSGYAPQEIGLPGAATLREYLEELAALDGLPPAGRAAAATAAAAAVHLQHVLQRRLRHFSGGMRRRVLLAQALLRPGPVLLVDEPTSGLDPAERITVHQLLRQRARQACVVVASHFIEDAEALPGRVAVLQAGRVVAEATTEALLASAAGRVWWCARRHGDPAEGVCLPHGGGGWRYVGSRPPGTGEGRPLPPTLEDAYFLALQQARPPARSIARRPQRAFF